MSGLRFTLLPNLESFHQVENSFNTKLLNVSLTVLIVNRPRLLYRVSRKFTTKKKTYVFLQNYQSMVTGDISHPWSRSYGPQLNLRTMLAQNSISLTVNLIMLKHEGSVSQIFKFSPGSNASLMLL